MVLSQFVSRRYAERLIEVSPHGVGYQLKQRISDVPTFFDDLHRVAAGGTALDPEVVQLMLGHARRGADPLSRLTERQGEVLALIAQGRSNSAIAARLQISEKAVVAHTSRIYTELDIPHDADDHRRVLAVLRYLRGGTRPTSIH
jgi:DNA-binding NarL/FixJ family response regulator